MHIYLNVYLSSDLQQAFKGGGASVAGKPFLLSGCLQSSWKDHDSFCCQNSLVILEICFFRVTKPRLSGFLYRMSYKQCKWPKVI